MVKNNIYPLVAPENVKGDFIVYSRDKYRKSQVKSGVYEDECLVAISVVSDNYDSAWKIAERIDNVLFGKHTNDSGVSIICSLEDSTETFVDNKYFETLIFRID